MLNLLIIVHSPAHQDRAIGLFLQVTQYKYPEHFVIKFLFVRLE